MNLKTSQRFEERRTLTQTDFQRFADLSGDDNPIHLDPVFSAQSRFGRTVAHGMFLYSCVTGAISRHMPEPGPWQISQDMMFPNATFAEEKITVELEVLEVDTPAGAVRLRTRTLKANGEPGLQGESWIRFGEKPWPENPNLALDEGPFPGEESKGFKGFAVGQTAELRRAFSSQDLAEYVDLAEDPNPWIVDPSFAQAHGMTRELVPAGLIGGLFSTLLGTQLPGRGTIYLKQGLQFATPAHPGEELTATVTISGLRPEKQLVNLQTTCVNPAGTLICRGGALVLISDVQ